jgi:ribonuclease HII
MPSEPTCELESTLWSAGHRYVAGLDEAGRGCLAGPVVAAAVVFRRGEVVEGVRDSKTLKKEDRVELAAEIRRSALAVGVGMCSPEEIDELNILWASMEAMKRAVFGLRLKPDYLVVDGNRCYPECPFPFETVIGGDESCVSIAAASIIAKTERDRFMRKLHREHPEFEWRTNVGYPTRAHYDALAVHGPTPHHRRSFRLS